MKTVDDVKYDLPDVTADWDGILYICKVTGRKNQFASVEPIQKVDGARIRASSPVWQYAWETVTNAVNTGKPLRV